MFVFPGGEDKSISKQCILYKNYGLVNF